MSAELVTADAEYARQLTDRIKVAVEGTWHLIAEAYQSRAWASLGYGSWDDYCTREFGTSRLKLPHEERMGTVKSLRQSGLSVRAIAAATGEGVGTVHRALAESPVPNGTPEGVPAGDVDVETGEFLAAEGSDAEAAAEVETPMVRAKVTGIDGKEYPSAPAVKRTPNRKPLTDAAKSAGFELRSAMERVEKLFDDDRYRSNAEQVANVLRGHLLYVSETVAAVLEQLS